MLRSIFVVVRARGGQALAASAFVISATVGFLTNVVTGQRGWGLVAGIAALTLLVGCGAALAWVQQGKPEEQASPSLATVAGAARELATARASQIGHIDEMPVPWAVTEKARNAMAAELGDDAGAMSQFAGRFQGFGLQFTKMRPPRLVILGDGCGSSGVMQCEEF